ASQALVNPANHLVFRQERPPPARHLADGTTNALHRTRRRTHPKVGPPPSRRVALADGVTQKQERIAGHATDARLPFLDRQLELLHHAPHDVHRLVGGVTTTDHEVVSVV